MNISEKEIIERSFGFCKVVAPALDDSKCYTVSSSKDKIARDPKSTVRLTKPAGYVSLLSSSYRGIPHNKDESSVFTSVASTLNGDNYVVLRKLIVMKAEVEMIESGRS